MDSSWLCYGVLGVWCNLNISSLDSLPRPPIFGEMVKLAQISPKIRRCPHSPTSRSQTAQLMKTGKYSFDRGIIMVPSVLRCLQCFDAVGWAAGRASGL